MKDSQRKAIHAKGYKVSFKNAFTKGQWLENKHTYKSLSEAVALSDYMKSQHYPKSKDWSGALRPLVKTETRITKL